jgi:hypothetical protein
MRSGRESPRNPLRTLAIGVCVAGMTLACLPAPASAQPKPTTTELNPPIPAPPKTEGTSRLITILEAIVLASLIVGVNLIPSKRGHQD